MRFLVEQEILDWHRDLSIQLDEHGRRFTSKVPGWEVCGGPMCMETNRARAFTLCLCNALGEWQKCLLWISAWGIWESSQQMPLYLRLRQSLGDNGFLHQARGHLCTPEDKDDLISLVYLCVVFGWDFSLTTDTDQARIFGSHDEFVEAAFRSENDCSAFMDIMQSFFPNHDGT